MMGLFGKGGFSLVVRVQSGQTLVGLHAHRTKLKESDLLPCSVVGLYNVLNGVDYVAIRDANRLLIRPEGKSIEVCYLRGRSETVLRLTKEEYRAILTSSEGARAA